MGTGRVIAGIVAASALLAGCSSGSDLSAADQALADKAWDRQTGIAQKALCVDLADPKKAAKAADDLEETLASADLKKNDNDVIKNSEVGAVQRRKERAAAVVEYIQGKC